MTNPSTNPMHDPLTSSDSELIEITVTESLPLDSEEVREQERRCREHALEREREQAKKSDDE